MPLTYKQRLFVEAYLGKANGNAAEAARMAGYSSPEIYGRAVLSKAIVRAAVDARLSEAAMSANEVLARISEFASGSLDPFLVIGGPIWTVDLKQAKKRGAIRLLKKIKQGEHGTEIEIHSPLDALDKLARFHGLYKERPLSGRDSQESQEKRIPVPDVDERPKGRKRARSTKAKGDSGDVPS